MHLCVDLLYTSIHKGHSVAVVILEMCVNYNTYMQINKKDSFFSVYSTASAASAASAAILYRALDGCAILVGIVGAGNTKIAQHKCDKQL